MSHNVKSFMNKHSRHYLEMALNYEKRQRLIHPDGYGKRTGACGDTVEIFLEVDHECISRTMFETDGCLNTNACANTVSLLSENIPIQDAWDITAEDIIQYLESLPQNEHHCAELAVGAFYLALTDYEKNQRAPWRKIYKT